MMNKTRLGKVVAINPDSISRDFPYQEIEYIDISSVGSGTLEGTKTIAIGAAPSRAKRLVQDGDTIVSTVRPNRRSFLHIKNPLPNTVVSTGFAVIRASDAIDKKFLYYIVNFQPFTDYLTARAKGAAYPAVDTDTIADAEIPLPPLPTQRKIAGILSAYDDLIENNTRRIKILEEMAQRIYREWFVNFRFPGHENVKMVDSRLGKIPEGWEVKKFGDFSDLERGLSHKGKYLAEDGLPLVNLKSIKPGGGYRRDGLKFYTGEYKARQTVKEGDIFIANTDLKQTGPIIGNAAIVPKLGDGTDIILTHHLYAVRFKAHFKNYELFFYLTLNSPEHKSHALGHANGTTVLGLSRDSIVDYSFLKPTDDLLEKFKGISNPSYHSIENLHKKNETLRRTRDLLLPKLISDQVDVSELDIETGGENIG